LNPGTKRRKEVAVGGGGGGETGGKEKIILWCGLVQKHQGAEMRIRLLMGGKRVRKKKSPFSLTVKKKGSSETWMS